MSTSTPATINDKTTELARLLMPHRNTPIMQRVDAFTIEKTGSKLTAFLGSTEIEEEKKNEILDRLISIIKDGHFDELPAAAAGQASAAPVVRPVAPPVVAAPAPAPKPKAAPKPEPAAEPAADGAVAPVEHESDPAAELAAVLTRMAAKGSKPGLTEADVRRIVRAELSEVFTKIAGVLAK